MINDTLQILDELDIMLDCFEQTAHINGVYGVYNKYRIAINILTQEYKRIKKKNSKLNNKLNKCRYRLKEKTENLICANSIINEQIEMISEKEEKIKKIIDYIGIDKETEECCEMFDVNGIEILKIVKENKE